jgi:hypothetical protein
MRIETAAAKARDAGLKPGLYKGANREPGFLRSSFADDARM